MNKQEFLSNLNRKLKGLKSGERKKYIEYYEEIISDIVESGVSEEEAIMRQGNPEQIAQDILSNAGPAHLKTRDWWGIALVTVSALLLLACIVPALLLWQFAGSMSTSLGIIGGAD